MARVRQADGTKKRTRTCHATQDLAIAAMNEAKKKREWHGDSAISISHEDIIRYTRARATLAALGATIEQAVAYFARHSRAFKHPVPLKEALEKCVEEKERLGNRKHSLQQFRCSCISFNHPDVAPIYRARVLRGQMTYQGREKFWVDERKLAALREPINAQNFGKLSTGEWHISITRADFGLRVTVRKRGNPMPADEAAARRLANRIQSRFKEIAAGLLRAAMQEAGFRSEAKRTVLDKSKKVRANIYSVFA